MALTDSKKRPQRTFDTLLEMKDAGLIAASAAAEVDSAAKIVDIGTGHYRAELIVDVTAVEIASNDERYDIVVQLSNSATFASGIVDAAALPIGALQTLTGDQDSAAGRYKVMFDNEYNGTFYRYCRVYTVVAGTIATGVNYSAFIGELK